MPHVLDDSKRLSKKYKKQIDYFNYPGKIFYLSDSFNALTYGLNDYYGLNVSFVFVRVKNGASFWELPMSIGPLEKVIKQIEEGGRQYLEDQKSAVGYKIKKFEEALSNSKIENGKI